MKYSLTPERAAKLVETLLGPFEVRDRTKDSWKGRFWELGSDDPKRQVVVWDRDGEAFLSFDRNGNILTISMNHYDKLADQWSRWMVNKVLFEGLCKSVVKAEQSLEEK